MTTAPIEAADGGSGVDETIGLNVHVLLYRRKLEQKELALALGITPSVLSKKLRGISAWSARQVAITADFLDIDPGKLFAQHSLAKVAPQLALITGNGAVTAPTLPFLHSLPTDNPLD